MVDSVLVAGQGFGSGYGAGEEGTSHRVVKNDTLGLERNAARMKAFLYVQGIGGAVNVQVVVGIHDEMCGEGETFVVANGLAGESSVQEGQIIAVDFTAGILAHLENERCNLDTVSKLIIQMHANLRLSGKRVTCNYCFGYKTGESSYGTGNCNAPSVTFDSPKKEWKNPDPREHNKAYPVAKERKKPGAF